MKAITNYINNSILMFLHYQYLTILSLLPCSLCHANDKTSIFNSDILANCWGNNELSSCPLSLEKTGQQELCTPSRKTIKHTAQVWRLHAEFLVAALRFHTSPGLRSLIKKFYSCKNNVLDCSGSFEWISTEGQVNGCHRNCALHFIVFGL